MDGRGSKEKVSEVFCFGGSFLMRLFFWFFIRVRKEFVWVIIFKDFFLYFKFLREINYYKENKFFYS